MISRVEYPELNKTEQEKIMSLRSDIANFFDVPCLKNMSDKEHEFLISFREEEDHLHRRKTSREIMGEWEDQCLCYYEEA